MTESDRRLSEGRVVYLVAPLRHASRATYRVLVSEDVVIEEATFPFKRIRIGDLPPSIRSTSISVTGDETTMVHSYTTPRGISQNLNIHDWVRILTQGQRSPEDRPTVTVFRTEGLPTVRGKVVGYQSIPGNGSMLIMMNMMDDTLSMIDVSHIGGFDMPVSASVFAPSSSAPKPNEMDINVQSLDSVSPHRVSLSYELSSIDVAMQTSVRHMRRIETREGIVVPKGAELLWKVPYLVTVDEAIAHPFVNIYNRTGEDLANIKKVRFPVLLPNDEYVVDGVGGRKTYGYYEESSSRGLMQARGGGGEEEAVDKGFAHRVAEAGVLIADWEAPEGERMTFTKGRLSRALPVVHLQTYEFVMASLDDDAKGEPMPLYEYIWANKTEDNVGLFPSTVAFHDIHGERYGESRLGHTLSYQGRDHALLRIGRNTEVTHTLSSQRVYFNPKEDRTYESRIDYLFRADNASADMDYVSVMLYVDVPARRSSIAKPVFEVFNGKIERLAKAKPLFAEVENDSIFSPLKVPSISRGHSSFYYRSSSVQRYIITFVGIPRGGHALGSLSVWTTRV